MSALQAYISNKKVQKVLSTKPGQKGFSLIELVVVVAVLAVLSAIAIPNFTNISNKARAAAASATMTTIVKECAAKIADAGTGQYVVPSLNGYTSWSDGTVRAVGTAQTCLISSGTYTLTSSDPTQYPTWAYNVGTAAKTCVSSGAALQRGCGSSQTW